MRIGFFLGWGDEGGGIFCCLFHLIIKAPITYTKCSLFYLIIKTPITYTKCSFGGRRGHVRMIDGFETTCAINISCKFESRSSRGALDTTLCDKVCQ